MKYKTFFRLLMKALGVYFTVQGVIGFVSGGIHALSMLLDTSFRGVGLWRSVVFVPISGLLETLVGLYLFSGGEWIVNKAIPSNRPYCHECGYDLSHPAGEVCPECGTAVVHTRTPEGTTTATTDNVTK